MQLQLLLVILTLIQEEPQIEHHLTLNKLQADSRKLHSAKMEKLLESGMTEHQ